LFIPVQETEQSTFNFVAVLDDTVDKKDDVFNVLNIFFLYEKFRLSVLWLCCSCRRWKELTTLWSSWRLNMIQLWIGYFHTLVTGTSTKICDPSLFSYTLMQIWSSWLPHSTMVLLLEFWDCSKFCVTHWFLLEAWEVILRHQVKIFLSYISDDFIAFQHHFGNLISDVIFTLDLLIGEDNICDRYLWSKICCKKDV